MMAGRPPLPPDERRTSRIPVYATAEQIQTLKRRAAAKHMHLSTYLLMAGLGELLPGPEHAGTDTDNAVP